MLIATRSALPDDVVIVLYQVAGMTFPVTAMVAMASTAAFPVSFRAIIAVPF